MAGRGMRARAPVSYSDKGSGMVPAWLKTIQPNVNDPPAEPKKKKKAAQSKKKKDAGSPNKENASDSGKESPVVGKRPTAKTSGGSKKSSGSGNGKQTNKKKNDTSGKDTKRIPARGRNAGLTVVPIVDLPSSSREISGAAAPAKKKSGRSKKGSTKAEAKREVPGLPWAHQRSTVDEVDLLDEETVSEHTPSPEPSKLNVKRKGSPIAGPDQLGGIAAKIGHISSSKKVKEAGNQFDIAGLMKSIEGLHGGSSSPRLLDTKRYLNDFSTSPDVYKIQLPEISGKHVQEMRDSMASLVDLCKKLEEENAALKDLKIREDIEQVIEIQNDKVREHGKAAAEVAEHWKSEAERLADLVDTDKVAELNQKVRELQSRISELELEVNDLSVSNLEKESRITELQKRNAFLEKYARIYTTADKCVGTDSMQGMDVGIQAPHGVAKMHARSLVPEGVPSNSLYTYGQVDAAGPTWGLHRGQREWSYEMQPQATIPHAGPSGRYPSSTHGTVSGHQGKGDIPGTKESRVQVHRRVSVQPGSLLGPDGQPKQIEFYSGSRSSIQGAKLPPVQEGGDDFARITAEERELLDHIGLEAEVSGNGIIYNHPTTGFMFKICPAEDEDDDEESGPSFDLEYVPLAWGTARDAIGQCQVLQDQLLERMSFMSGSKAFLLKEIGDALGKVFNK